MDLIATLDKFSFDSKYVWVMYVFFIVLVTMVVSFIQGRFFKKIEHKFIKTPNLWDDALITALNKPLKYGIWLMGLTFAAEVVAFWQWHAKDANFLTTTIFPLRRVGLVFLITWFLVRLTNNVEKSYSEFDKPYSKIDKGTAHALGNLVRISLFITAGLITLEVLHIEIAPILAFGGAGTIIIGFASKDLLSNFFGALMVHLDRPFSISDNIKIYEKNIEGTVEYIGWRLTRIRNYDKRPVYVPNSVFTTVAIENTTRMSNRRIREFVGVRYRDINQVIKISEEATELLKNHPHVDTSSTCSVTLHQFGSSSLDLLIYAFTKTTKWADFLVIKQDIFVKILEVIESHGAEAAFPTTTIEVPDGIRINKHH